LEQLEKRDLLAADVYISEIVAVNETSFADDDGDFPDWLEIFNAGPDDVDLEGWHLTDDAEELRKWSFPSQNLAAGSALVVYASDKDRADSANPLHTNFKLSGDGEYLALTQDVTPTSAQVVSEFAPQYPEQFADISYGVTQGAVGNQVIAGDRLYFESPTPGELNPASGVEGYLTNEITFSQPAGFYETAVSLTLAAKTTGTTIQYTVDGSEPTTTNGTEYSAPIPITETTTLRARAFKDGFDPSFVATQTFIFLEDVLEQRRSTTIAAGFPSSTAINGQLIDYGMDPDIVNDSTWAPQMVEALTQIPSLSVVMNVDDLMGSREGIFVNATRKGDAWERAASLELLNPDGAEGFQVDAGIRVRGGYSRRDDNPKHSFRFLFREEYGDAKLEYPMFGEEGVSEFDKLDLRTAQNYSWSFNGSSTNTFLRDVFSRDMQREMEQPYARSRFYHLYLNGQYWGLFQTQERTEARYAASHFGGDREDYDIVKNADSLAVGATDGNLDAYNRLADFFYEPGGLGDANMDAYMRAQGMNPDGTVNPDYERLLDVDNLMDYMAITYYTGDKDGPGSRFTTPRVNNYYAMYNRENPDGWKFFEHDSEHTFDVGDVNMVQPYTTGGAQRQYFNPHWAHEQLARNNAEYRIKFADRIAELVLNDGLLTTDNVNAMIDSRAAEIDMAIIAESARWGDAKRPTDPRTKDDWLAAVQRLRDFAENREEILIAQLRNVGWYPDSDAPALSVDGTPKHGGEIEPTSLVTIEKSAPPIDFNRTLINDRTTWSYLDDGSDQGTAWRQLDFDDEAWESGRAQLGYGGNGERTEIGFGGNANDKHVTTYFRKTFSTTRADEIEVLKVRIARDDGAVVYLNGTELARTGMPAGEINYDTGAAGVASGGNETAFFEFEVPADVLVNGENQVAVEVHQVKSGNGNVTSSDITFDLELIGGSQVTVDDIKTYYTTDGTDPRLPGGALGEAKEYDGNGFFLSSTSKVAVRTLTTDGEWSPLISAQFNVGGESLLGDLNNDAQLNAADIDLLVAGIREGTNAPSFDLNQDGDVNDTDRTYMIETIFQTREGDTDLDGDVDFADFLVLSTNFGNANSGWTDGNFDTDDEVSFADFLLLSANFGLNPLNK